MSEPDFKSIQRVMTQHLRDPDNHPAPIEIEERRMEIYRGLLYRNIETFIRKGFPVIRRLYTDENWHAMVRDFVANARCQSPYFRHIPLEFVRYLETQRTMLASDPPFLKELAHYEWVEVEVKLTDAQVSASINKPTLSPLARMRGYHYPVHKISPSFMPTEPLEQPVFLLVYRDANDEVQFTELSPLTAMMLELLRDNVEHTQAQIIASIATALPDIDERVIHEQGSVALAQLIEMGIVI